MLKAAVLYDQTTTWLKLSIHIGDIYLCLPCLLHDLTLTMESTVNDTHCDGDATLDLRFAGEEQLAGYFYSQEERFIILAFYPISFLFGLVANISFLLVLFQIREMRTITNAYLGNLAVADILFLCSVDYHFLFSYFPSPKVKSLAYTSSAGCAINVTIQYMAHFASIALVFLMTVERYLGICKTFYHRLIIAKGRTLKLIIFAWVFGLAYACAFVAPRSYVLVKTCVLWPESDMYLDLPNVLHSRSPLHPFYKQMPSILQAVPFSAAMICTIVMYALIVKKLTERVSTFNQGDQQSQQISKVRDNVARLLIANGTVFFLAYVPFYVTRFNYALLAITDNRVGYQTTPNVRGAIDWSVVCLATVNSFINPVIYSLTNERYRRAFVHVFTCQTSRMKTNKSNVSSISQSGTSNTISHIVMNNHNHVNGNDNNGNT